MKLLPNNLLLLGAILAVIGESHIPPTSAADAAPALALREIAKGFVSPLNLLTLDDGSGRLLVGDQAGIVRVIQTDGSLADRPFLDVRDRLTKLTEGFDERGLLGIVLHPQYKKNRKLYVYYSAPRRSSAPPDWDHTSRVSEFVTSEKEPLQVDPSSERILMEFDQPYFNHNSGRLAFGPDTFLYIASGDGGNANDIGRGHSPQGNGQDLSTFLGKILRIDVDKAKPYGIPSDNPFIRGEGRPEIFAYGLRNPWGMSFDRGGTHQMFVADVGQDRYEEVDIVVKGGNYGWNLREGFDGFNPQNPKRPPESVPKLGADGTPLLDPILAYKSYNGFPRDPEAVGISVTGGYVYRGKQHPHLKGRYVFADWSGNRLKPGGVLLVASQPETKTTKQWTLQRLETAGSINGVVKGYIVALGEDAEGELYVLTNDTNGLIGTSGKVFKLVKAAPGDSARATPGAK